MKTIPTPPRCATLAALLCACWPAHADLRIASSVDTRATCTDNVTLAPDGQERGRTVFELDPAVRLAEETPRFHATALAQLHLFYYGGYAPPGTRRHLAQLSAGASGEVVPNLLYVDASAAVSQQPVSAFAQPAGASPFAAANSAEMRSWRISPYLVHRFGNAASGQLRYSHDDVSGEAQGFGRTRSDAWDATLAGTVLRRIGWNLAGRRSVLTDGLDRSAETDQATAGLRWDVTPSVSSWLSTGFDRYDFHRSGGVTRGSFRSLGASWTPSARTSVEASVGHRFFGRTGTFALRHRSRLTAWTLDYGEDVTTTRDQFVLPATLDTAALLDRLLRPSFPDAAERARAVEAYMAANKLPPSLIDNVAYLSNRYFVQKQLKGAAAFRMAHTQLIVAVHDTRRHALSAFEADSSLLGTSFARLHDDTRQRGVDLMATGQLGSRTTWAASAAAAHTRSLGTGQASSTRTLRMSISRKFARDLAGTVELRRTAGSLLGSANYRENAIAASLHVQF
ncbi:MAG: TIGR03016 family PEP-CTERM system-associated outer membrane protein [Telluria sp.]